MFDKHKYILDKQNKNKCQIKNTQKQYEFSRNEFFFIPLYNIIYSICILLLVFYCIYVSDYLLFLYNVFIQKEDSSEDKLILKKFLSNDFFYISFINKKTKFLLCVFQLTLVTFFVNMFATFVICLLRKKTKESNKKKLKMDMLLIGTFTLLSTFAFFYVYI